MNGDLSLSRALGGLRIANPDGAPPTASPDNPNLGADDQLRSHHPVDPQSNLLRPRDAVPDLKHQDSRMLSGGNLSAPLPSSPSPSNFPSRQSSRRDASNPRSAGGHTGPSAAHHSSSHDLGLQYSAYQQQYQPDPRGQPNQPMSSHTPRPISTTFAPQQAPLSSDMDAMAALSNNPRHEPSRSSVYMAARAEAYPSSSYQQQPTPSRESSQRDRTYDASSRRVPVPVGGGPSGPLPPRRSSRGMAGGYVSSSNSTSGQPPQNPPSSQPDAGQPVVAFGPNDSMPQTSEEWKDRGAAVGVRRELDASGRTVIRHVKKGVRDFNFGRVLGEGSYSTVYLATDRQTLKEYAIKVLEKKHIIKEKKIKYVNIEKNTLNRLTEHPGIVRLYYTFQDESCLYYVLDLCNGGELLGVLKKTGTFDVDCTRFYGAQILDAIEYMHSRGVIHRDLKPENVLLDEQMHIKITDFGTAKLLRDPRESRGVDMADRGLPNGGDGNEDENDRAASFVGTAEYVSPELLTNKSACKASDLWAFGCIIYQLLAGRPPFKAGSEYLTFQKIVSLEYEFPPGFPPAARDLVERCLVTDPARRLTIEHIKNHEFFDGQPFGKSLWRAKAPRLRAYVVPTQEPNIIQLNGFSGAHPSASVSRGHSQQPQQQRKSPVNGGAGAKAARAIGEIPPPTPLDIEWSSVLTRPNERILKLGDLMVVSMPLPNSPHGKGEGEGHKKLSRFFGGSTTKKRQRLVLVTTGGRIILAPAGGEEKRSKQEIPLLSQDCTWRSQMDGKGQMVWCVDTGGIHYTFEEPKSPSGSPSAGSVDEWIESLDLAKDFAVAQNATNSYQSDAGFGEIPSTMSSPASTLGQYTENFTGDRSGRNHLSKGQPGADESVKRNRFSKRQSKSGLGPAAF